MQTPAIAKFGMGGERRARMRDVSKSSLARASGTAMRLDEFLARFESEFAPGDPWRALLMRRQLQHYGALVPMAVFGNVFNALVIVVYARAAAPSLALATWFCLVLALSGLRLGWRTGLDADIDEERLKHFVRDIVILAAASGVAWSLAIVHLLGAPIGSIAIPAMVGAGMMSAAASTLNVLPGAALAFIAPMAFGATLGFVRLDSAEGYAALALLLSYWVVLARSVVAYFSQFVARVRHEYELVEQADTVKLLLHDYQEHGADWLWTVDRQGRLLEVSQRFAEVAQRPAQTLSGRLLVDLFDACPEAEMLRDHLIHMRSFTDLTVPLTVAGERCWWTLCAHPRLGADRKSIVGLRGVATDVTEARRAEAKVAYMAHYDGLTDLPNRFLFNETLQRVLHRRRDDQTHAVLCLDLDQFKSVNDTLGHPIGDRLLTHVARRLESCLDEKDVAARLGGDEFAVLLLDIEHADCARVAAEKIVAALSLPIDVDGQHIVTATSIGIALAPQDGDDVAELLKNADLALYDAKGNGRGRHSYFTPAMDEAARRRRELEIDLRAALGRGQLKLHYQPLINVETGAVTGYEALMRWSHPERGAVPPADFIPIAEEMGLIAQLGEWVIREAINELSRWPEHLHVAVNLSPAQMRSPTLISTVFSALANAKVSARRLELEITESVLMQDNETNIATLHHLRDLGVRISLDDFGTGYSSLNYLRSFPFDKIKIDRCFIQGIDTNEDCRAIVSSVTTLAKQLGMITTAEGVERPEQLAEIANGGCTEAQGFLFSKAVPPEELTDLRRRTPVFPEFVEALRGGGGEAAAEAWRNRRTG
jgi:diguanylate cyclase (GGDEF)-like protein